MLFLLFSCPVVSDSLPSHGLQHTRLPCPSLPPGVCPSSLHRWCHPAISSSNTLFSFCSPSFPASGSFLNSQLFTLGGPSIGASASASVLPKNVQDWFPFGWTGLISLQFKGLSRVFCSTTVQKHQFSGVQLPLWPSSHIHTRPLEKPQPGLDGPLLALLFFFWNCFLYNPADVFNLISSSSSFSKPSLETWQFLVHRMLKPSMRDFKHGPTSTGSPTSMGDECNCLLGSTFFGTTLLGYWDEDWPFPVLWPLLGPPDLLTYWKQHLYGIIL